MQNQIGIYRHFLVEAKFEGHSATSKVEIIIRKPPGQRSFDQSYSQSQREPFLQPPKKQSFAQQSFSDFGIQDNQQFQDYVERMQYRHEYGSQNALQEGSRLGILPKMMAGQVNYGRLGEKAYLKQNQPLAISGSRDESEIENYGDLDILQHAYEDEVMDYEYHGN